VRERERERERKRERESFIGFISFILIGILGQDINIDGQRGRGKEGTLMYPPKRFQKIPGSAG